METTKYSYGFQSQNKERSEEPLKVTGIIPGWLEGTLIRTGPSKFEVGEDKYRHWFDGLAMLHKFEIKDHQVTYSCKYLQSEAYKKAIKKNRITIGEFGTDPCRDLFQKFVSFFKGPEITDNGCVNIIKYGNILTSVTETPDPKSFDLNTLETIGTFSFDDGLSGQLTPVHPHIDNEGNLYSYLTEIGYKSFYHIYTVEKGSKDRRVIASIPTKEFAYIHSFAMTENYVILMEYPLVAFPLNFRLSTKPFIEKFRWKEKRGTIIHLVNKNTGELKTIDAEPFFCFHHVNAFEENDDIIIDLVGYDDAETINDLYLDQLRTNKSLLVTGKLWRLNIPSSKDKVSKRILSELPLELPRTNYTKINTKPYKYVYAAANCETGNFLDALAKVNVNTGGEVIWKQENCYPGEPIFVQDSSAESEDEGVILSVVLDINKKTSFLLMLNATNLKEIARAEVPQHIPFGFHGQFLPPII